MTLTLLLANAGAADGFMAYSCKNVRSPVVGYDLTPQAGCWMRSSSHGSLEPKDGRILWMRDKAQFPVVHCKMTETVMQANCDSGPRNLELGTRNSGHRALEDDRDRETNPGQPT